MIKSVEELDVYKKAHKLTLKLYEITKSFPDDEKFGLISQIRRAASSINANLLEGSHRTNTKEFRQFCGIARGYAGELKYYLLLAKDLGYISTETYDLLSKETEVITKMLYGLIKSLSGSLK
jgi:four helix bundle protein